MKIAKFMFASAIALAIAAPAAAQTYSGGTGTFTGIGAAPTYPDQTFDIAAFTPVTGTYTGNGSYTLNNVAFTVGYNAFTAAPFFGAFTLTGMLGATPFNYSVNYSGTISNRDTITIGGNTVNILGQAVYFQPFTLNAGVGETVTGQLIAQVNPVPEPATWGMMILGFGVAGCAMRRRRVATTVSYA